MIKYKDIIRKQWEAFLYIIPKHATQKYNFYLETPT